MFLEGFLLVRGQGWFPKAKARNGSRAVRRPNKAFELVTGVLWFPFGY